MQLPLPPHQLHIYYGSAENRDTNSYEAKKWLRRVLALYAGAEEKDVNLSCGLNGKPCWKDFPEIQFNATHSHNAFALAFVRHSRVGIDLEDLRRPVDTKALSAFLLSEKEQQKFYSTDEKFHSEQMINAWTRKEAFVKAYGRGMSFPIQQLEVSFMLNEKVSVKETHWSAQEKNEWCLHSFDLAPFYRGAVAVQARIISVEVRNVELFNSACQ
jgi:4'-phosphopantetheinyl transferase